MLNDHEMVAFLATTDAARAKTFYAETLGLTLVEDSPFAIVLRGRGTELRVQKVTSHTPPPFTSLGWVTRDIAADVEALAARGIRCLEIGGLDQDVSGVWRSPSGAKVAWFKDPDGHTLSLTEHANRPG